MSEQGGKGVRWVTHQNVSAKNKPSRPTNGYPAASEALQTWLTCPLVSVCQELGVTAREHEVCQWLMQGKTNAEIAGILGISPRTAEKHVLQLLRKLHVENRTSAAIELLRRVERAGTGRRETGLSVEG